MGGGQNYWLELRFIKIQFKFSKAYELKWQGFSNRCFISKKKLLCYVDTKINNFPSHSWERAADSHNHHLEFGVCSEKKKKI